MGKKLNTNRKEICIKLNLVLSHFRVFFLGVGGGGANIKITQNA